MKQLKSQAQKLRRHSLPGVCHLRAEQPCCLVPITLWAILLSPPTYWCPKPSSSSLYSQSFSLPPSIPLVFVVSTTNLPVRFSSFPYQLPDGWTQSFIYFSFKIYLLSVPVNGDFNSGSLGWKLSLFPNSFHTVFITSLKIFGVSFLIIQI